MHLAGGRLYQTRILGSVRRVFPDIIGSQCDKMLKVKMEMLKVKMEMLKVNFNKKKRL